MYEIGLQQQLTATVGIDVSAVLPRRARLGRNQPDDPGLPAERPVFRSTRTRITPTSTESPSSCRNGTPTISPPTWITRSRSRKAPIPIPSTPSTRSQINQEPRLNLIPLDWDQRHTLNVRAMFKLAGWTCALIGQFWSGRPYTPTFPSGEAGGRPPTAVCAKTCRGDPCGRRWISPSAGGFRSNR